MQRRFGFLRPATLLSVVWLGICTNCSENSATVPDGNATPEAGSDASTDGAVALDAADATTDSDADADADVTIDCAEGMRGIPAGTFARPDAPVTTAAFCLDRLEVTLGEFRACVTDKKCAAIPVGPTGVDQRCNAQVGGRDDHPADCVTAAQAESFCAWKGKRLPTSDELSWAARGAVANATYPWGSADPTPLEDPSRLCWKHVSPDHTCVVGSFPSGASPQGVLDLAGNVWEWTATETAQGVRRVQGGAYWDEPLMLFRADYWEPMPADNAVPSYGFRCAK